MSRTDIYTLPLAYVYKVTNNLTGEFYIGSRKLNVKFNRTPEQDFLHYYFTSGIFKKELKRNPDIFTYQIIYRSNEKINIDNKEEWIIYWYEQLLILENWGNPLCRNKSYHNPNNKSQFVYKAEGTVAVVDSNGNTFRTNVDDPLFVSGELHSVNKGYTLARIKENGKLIRAHINDSRWITGEIEHFNKSKRCAFDIKTKNIVKVDVNDARFDTGELISITRKFVQRKHKITGEIKKFERDTIPDNDLWISVNSGAISVRNIQLQETFRIFDYNNHADYLNGICVPVHTKFVMAKNLITGEILEVPAKNKNFTDGIFQHIPVCIKYKEVNQNNTNGYFNALYVQIQKSCRIFDYKNHHDYVSGICIAAQKRKVSARVISTGELIITSSRDPRFITNELEFILEPPTIS